MEVGYAVLAVLATAIAATAASRAPVPVHSDLGLVAVLPATYWVGPITLNAIFALILPSANRHKWLITLLLGCLILTLYAPAALASGAARSEVPWRHIGVMNTMTNSGTIDPDIDAYFNWPGFFGGLALVTQAIGVSPFTVALWAPVGAMFLWSAALLSLVRGFTDDHRLQWLTLWLFALGNWIDQDYLSPQAFAYFLYLVVLALLLTWLSARPALILRNELAEAGPTAGLHRWWASRAPCELNPRRRCAALIIMVCLGAVTVVSHQLTPTVMLLSATALVLTGRCWSPRLPLILLIITLLWLAYGAKSYLAGHPVLFSQSAGSAMHAGMVDRLDGGPAHLVVLAVRIALTGALWGLAAIGAVRWLRSRRDLQPILLGAVPVLLVPVQSYGGEILMRVTLFALPFTAFLAANALLQVGNGHRARIVNVVTLCLVGSMLAAAMLTARFGNARFDTFAPTEIAAGRALYQIASPDALLVAGAHPSPWEDQAYTRKNTTLQNLCTPTDSAPTCLSQVQGRIRHAGKGAAIMLTRSNRESLRLQGLLSPQVFDQFEDLLRNTPGVVLAYQNRDARIYVVGGAK